MRSEYDFNCDGDDADDDKYDDNNDELNDGDEWSW